MKPSCEDTGRPNPGKLTLAAKYAVVFHLSESVTYLQLRRHGSHLNCRGLLLEPSAIASISLLGRVWWVKTLNGPRLGAARVIPGGPFSFALSRGL